MRPGVLILLLALVAAGCATRPGDADLRLGRVARIDPISVQSDHQLGVGSVLGAVAGGALGHPSGTAGSRAVAQVLGAVGGGYAREAPQEDYPARRAGVHLTVILSNGVSVGLTQLAAEGLRTGDCVRIDGAGETARAARAPCAGAAADAAPAPSATPQADALRDELRERIRERMAREQPPAPVTVRPAAAGEASLRFGRIVRVDAVRVRAEHELGVEGVINGVSGAVLVNPVPGGDARAFADVANALGSLSASTSDILYAVPQAGQLVTVRLDNGVTVIVTQIEEEKLRAGDAVRIEGAGSTARAVRA